MFWSPSLPACVMYVMDLALFSLIRDRSLITGMGGGATTQKGWGAIFLSLIRDRSLIVERGVLQNGRVGGK